MKKTTSFKKQVFQGIAWRSSVDFGQVILLIIFTAVLARLLTRVDFGLVAMALLFIRFIRSMTQVGFGTAIIQNQKVTEEQVSAIFIIHVGINIFVSLICFAGAPVVAIFFKEPKLISLVRALAWIILINSFSFPQILMRKRLQFGSYSLLEMGSMVLSNVVAIFMAFKGFGVWALVFRQLTQRILFSIGIWPLARWFPVKPRFTGVGKLFRFGLNMLGSNICYYFSQNLAAIIIGKFISVETLGSFNIAYNLAITPAQKVQSVLTSVLTPAFSKVKSSVADFGNKLSASIFSLGIVFIPLMLGVAAVAQNFIVVVYGEKWREAGLFLTFLAVIGMLKGIEHLLRSAIIARGWASVIFGITIAETAVSLPLLFLGSYFFDATGLILAYMVASSISFVLTVRAAQRSVEDNSIFFRATLRSFISAGIMFIVVLVYSFLVPLQVMVTLCTQIGLGIVLYAILRIKFLTEKERATISIWPLSHLVLAKK